MHEEFHKGNNETSQSATKSEEKESQNGIDNNKEAISVVISEKLDETLSRLEFVLEIHSKKPNDVFLVNFQTLNPAKIQIGSAEAWEALKIEESGLFKSCGISLVGSQKIVGASVVTHRSDALIISFLLADMDGHIF